MPELPEVEIVRRGLEPEVLGRSVHELRVFRPDLRYAFPDDFSQMVVGRSLQTLTRRAKFLIFDFGGSGFLGHLGMTGNYRTAPLDAKYEKHDHFALVYEDFQVIYHDPRRFGAVDSFEGNPLLHPWLFKLGMEPLSEDFDGRALFEALKTRKTSIKSALLNQNIIAGLGNIYVCEALWQSGIAPLRLTYKIKRPDAEVLAENIKDVLERALRAGGSTLRDFRNASGDMGYFQHEFHVYDREGEACKNSCGESIRRITQSGRSSFYCPSCQKR